MLRTISLGSLGILVGAVLSVVGMAAYVSGNSTLNLVGFFYGIPLLLGGAALKSSEVKPLPELFPPTAEVLALRNAQATPTQKQIREDVTRYRYGIADHLDAALAKLGLSPTDAERPRPVGIYEEVTRVEGGAAAYTLVLRFESPKLPLETWQARQAKIEAFFGPQVKAQLSPVGEAIELRLTRDPASL